MEPKDRIEEGMPPLDLEDDGYYVDNEDFAIDDLYPEDDPEMDYYDSLDDELEDDEDDLMTSLMTLKVLMNLTSTKNFICSIKT